jgi:hypothetical protein
MNAAVFMAAAGELKTASVDVAGEPVSVREPSAADIEFASTAKGLSAIRLVCRCVIDAEGRRLFGDNDLERIGGLPSEPVGRVFDRIISLMGDAAAGK